MVHPSASVNFLPYELMSMIFLEVIRTQSRPSVMKRSPYFAKPRPDYVSVLRRLSQVCKRWRAITLGQRQLWASAINVDTDRCEWAREIVHRAQNVPLAIHSRTWTDSTASFWTKTWRYIFANMDKWGSFSVQRSIYAKNTKSLASALTKPAPNLRSFALLVHGTQKQLDRDGPHKSIVYPSFDLPNNLFGGNAPRLEQFSISNVYISPLFDFSIWKQLTSLSVDQDYTRLRRGQYKIFAWQWLEVLRGMTQLEYLDLGWSWYRGIDAHDDTDSDPRTTDIPKVHLDRLRALRMHAGCERNIMLDVFSRLIVPNNCSTSVHIRVLHPSIRLNALNLNFDRLHEGLYHRVKRWRECGHVNGPDIHVALRDSSTIWRESVNLEISIPSCKAKPFPGQGSECLNFEFVLDRYERVSIEDRDTVSEEHFNSVVRISNILQQLWFVLKAEFFH